MTPQAIPLYVLATLDPPARLAARAYAAARGAHRLRLALSVLSTLGYGAAGVVLVTLSAVTAPAAVQLALEVSGVLVAVAVGWRMADTVYALQCRRLDVLCLLVGDDAAVPLEDFELREWTLGALHAHRISTQISADGLIRPAASWLWQQLSRRGRETGHSTALQDGYARLALTASVALHPDFVAGSPPAAVALALTLALDQRPVWLDASAIRQAPIARVLSDLHRLAARNGSRAAQLACVLAVCPAAMREPTVAAAVAATLRAHEGLLADDLQEETP